MMNQMDLVKSEICKVIRGKDDVIDMVLCAILAKGHVLLEDIPGVGKTTLAVALSKSMSMAYRRMQFTPDVLPSDILGFSLPDPKTGEFVFRPGAIFTNLFLADEINRTSPKTQSALLEVMEEGSVSIDGVTRILAKPFCVIATQNPIGASGTQKLPDSQLDRFLVRVSLGYPDHGAAMEILRGMSAANLSQVQAVLTRENLVAMQKQVEKIYVCNELVEYMVNLVETSRKSEYLTQGISPRGSLALLSMAKANAYKSGRDYVVTEDVTKVWFAIGNHRVILNTKAKAAGLSAQNVMERVLECVPMPKLDTTRR